MKPLDELQTLFSQAIDTVYGSAAASDRQQQFIELIHTNTKLPAAERLRIYAGSYYENLIGRLSRTFPVLRLTVGDSNFRYLAIRFIKSSPSQSQNIHHYGARLAAFLGDFAKLEAGVRQLPFLAALAELEWIWDQLIFAADDQPTTSEAWQALATLAPESQAQLRLQPSQSLQLLNLDYTVHHLWLRLSQADGVAQPSDENFTDVQRQSELLVAWRRHFTPRLVTVTPLQVAFLEAVRAGLGYAEALEKAAQQLPDDDPAPLAELLPQAVQAGWVVGYSTP